MGRCLQIFSVRRRHCQLRVKPLWPAWNNEIRGKYSRQSDTTKLLERCFKNCATAARCIPNLAVLWLSWSGRDFIGGLVRRADLSCWHFNLGSEIWLLPPSSSQAAKSCGSTSKGREQTQLQLFAQTTQKPRCEANFTKVHISSASFEHRGIKMGIYSSRKTSLSPTKQLRHLTFLD